MGIFNFFRNRRARETALQSPEQQAAIQQALAQAQVQAAQAGHLGGQPGPAGQVPAAQGEGMGALAGLGVLLSQLSAAQQAGVSVESSNQVIDMRGSGLREEILGVIAAHGIDPNQSGEVDASSADGLQQDILAVLARSGIDVSAATAGMPFAVVHPPEDGSEPEPLDPTVPQIRNPFDPR